MKKARLKRADEFINRELKRQDAETDVVQSGADVKRNLSKGAQSYLEGAGKGLENAGKNQKPSNVTINNKTIEKF
jgi:hypothetical protein